MHALGFSLLLLIATTARAETQYVTDHVLFHLMEKPKRNAKRLGTIPSGSKVTVLENGVEKKYSKVKTEDGAIGYIQSRRLVKQTTANRKNAALNNKISSLKEQLNKRTPTAPKVMTETVALKKLKKELKKKSAKIRSLKQELTSLQHISRNELRIAQERNRLYRKTEELSKNQEQLKQQLKNADKSNLLWLLLGGALIMLLGLMMGLLLPHLNSGREAKAE